MTGAVTRQELFLKRVRGEAPPWTDPIIASHRFTNVYRTSDRVSQYLIRHVLYEGDAKPEEVFLRTMLFKLFNKVETWERLRDRVGAVTRRSFDVARYERALNEKSVHPLGVARVMGRRACRCAASQSHSTETF